MGCCDNQNKDVPQTVGLEVTQQPSGQAASCCGGKTGQQQLDQVREGYASIAEKGWVSISGSCCGTKEPLSSDFLAEKLGYSPEQLEALPESANMGLSCGNPTAIASLQPGEVVVDLGSGGGFDCFLAGPKVGATGRVIGVDMTPEMLAKARRNIASYEKSTGLSNVEFRLGEIEYLPLADASVDVVISNCVINLSSDKRQVWQEIARILKPGGRVAASDMALLQPLPEAVMELMEALVGCVSGAVLMSDYQAMIEEAGLKVLKLNAKPEYVAAMEQMQDPLYEKIGSLLPAGSRPRDYITSVDVQAVRETT